MKINKKYPLVVKNISEDGKKMELSFRYVSKPDGKAFLQKIGKYQKSLRIFKNFLAKIERKYSDEFYNSMAEKTIWNVEKDDLYEYLISYYMGHNNLESFDIDNEQKEIFRQMLEKFFGKLKINTKYLFSIKNPNYGGVEDIKNIFNTIKDEYNTDIIIDNIPQYFISITSESEKGNNEIISNIEQKIQEMSKNIKCLYKKNDVITTNNL